MKDFKRITQFISGTSKYTVVLDNLTLQILNFDYPQSIQYFAIINDKHYPISLEEYNRLIVELHKL